MKNYLPLLFLLVGCISSETDPFRCYPDAKIAAHVLEDGKEQWCELSPKGGKAVAHGGYKRWDSDGVLQEYRYYHFGKVVRAITYFPSPNEVNPQVKAVMSFDNDGKPHGWFGFYEKNNKLARYAQYNKGKLVAPANDKEMANEVVKRIKKLKTTQLNTKGVVRKSLDKKDDLPYMKNEQPIFRKSKYYILGYDFVHLRSGTKDDAVTAVTADPAISFTFGSLYPKSNVLSDPRYLGVGTFINGGVVTQKQLGVSNSDDLVPVFQVGLKIDGRTAWQVLNSISISFGVQMVNYYDLGIPGHDNLELDFMIGASTGREITISRSMSLSFEVGGHMFFNSNYFVDYFGRTSLRLFL